MSRDALQVGPFVLADFNGSTILIKTKYVCKTCRLKIVVMLIGIDAHTVGESLGGDPIGGRQIL